MKTLIFSIFLLFSFSLGAQTFTTLPSSIGEDYIEKNPYVIISEGYPTKTSEILKKHIQQELFFSHRKFEVGGYRHDLWEADYGFKFNITIVCAEQMDGILCNYVFTGPEDVFTISDLYNYLDSGTVKGTSTELTRVAAIIVQEFNKTVDNVHNSFVKSVQRQLGMDNIDGILGTKTRRCIKQYQLFLVTRRKVQGESHLSLSGALNISTIESLGDNYPNWAYRYPTEYFACR